MKQKLKVIITPNPQSAFQSKIIVPLNLQDTSNPHSPKKQIILPKPNSSQYKKLKSRITKEENPKPLHPLPYYEKQIYQKFIQTYTTKQKTVSILNKIIVNSFMFNKSLHIVAIFKDKMIMDFIDEFLKRRYSLKESKERLPKFYEFYKNYLMFFCRPLLTDLYINELIKDKYDRKAEIYYNQNFKKTKNKNDKDKDIGYYEVDNKDKEKDDNDSSEYNNNKSKFFNKSNVEKIETDSIYTVKVYNENNELTLLLPNSSHSNTVLNETDLLEEESNNNSFDVLLGCLNNKYKNKNKYYFNNNNNNNNYNCNYNYNYNNCYSHNNRLHLRLQKNKDTNPFGSIDYNKNYITLNNCLKKKNNNSESSKKNSKFISYSSLITHKEGNSNKKISDKKSQYCISRNINLDNLINNNNNNLTLQKTNDKVNNSKKKNYYYCYNTISNNEQYIKRSNIVSYNKNVFNVQKAAHINNYTQRDKTKKSIDINKNNISNYLKNCNKLSNNINSNNRNNKYSINYCNTNGNDKTKSINKSKINSENNNDKNEINSHVKNLISIDNILPTFSINSNKGNGSKHKNNLSYRNNTNTNTSKTKISSNFVTTPLQTITNTNLNHIKKLKRVSNINNSSNINNTNNTYNTNNAISTSTNKNQPNKQTINIKKFSKNISLQRNEIANKICASYRKNCNISISNNPNNTNTNNINNTNTFNKANQNNKEIMKITLELLMNNNSTNNNTINTSVTNNKNKQSSNTTNNNTNNNTIHVNKQKLKENCHINTLSNNIQNINININKPININNNINITEGNGHRYFQTSLNLNASPNKNCSKLSKKINLQNMNLIINNENKGEYKMNVKLKNYCNSSNYNHKTRNKFSSYCNYSNLNYGNKTNNDSCNVNDKISFNNTYNNNYLQLKESLHNMKLQSKNNHNKRFIELQRNFRNLCKDGVMGKYHEKFYSKIKK